MKKKKIEIEFFFYVILVGAVKLEDVIALVYSIGYSPDRQEASGLFGIYTNLTLCQ